AVDAGMHGSPRSTGHCELDTGIAERGGDGGFDGRSAGAGGRADFCRGNIGVRNSQQHALAAIQGVATIASAILSLVASVSSKAAVAHMAAQSGVKLSMVRPY